MRDRLRIAHFTQPLLPFTLHSSLSTLYTSLPMTLHQSPFSPFQLRIMIDTLDSALPVLILELAVAKVAFPGFGRLQHGAKARRFVAATASSFRLLLC